MSEVKIECSGPHYHLTMYIPRELAREAGDIKSTVCYPLDHLLPILVELARRDGVRLHLVINSLTLRGIDEWREQ